MIKLVWDLVMSMATLACLLFFCYGYWWGNYSDRELIFLGILFLSNGNRGPKC